MIRMEEVEKTGGRTLYCIRMRMSLGVLDELDLLLDSIHM